ncbi:MAG TPA: radical SAM protein [Clostridiales bacterium]|nr:radical SAM protein [Clostridiales bacterium]
MVQIKSVTKNSIAAKSGIAAGDLLQSINGREVNDVIDYRFFITEKKLSMLISHDGTEYKVNILKGQYADIGLEFGTYLMDEKRRCKNNCIFCFIDQNPKGMRETIYFKDDDERLSFLFGNYITLTNLKDADLERIIEMHISPVNVSVHTTNPELRVKMMNNRFAGDVLEKLKRLAANHIAINAQIVLCRGYNDSYELTHTMDDLKSLFPSIQSVAIVPSGITKYRKGLVKLIPYDKQASAEVIQQITKYGDDCVESMGHRIFFPADEFYVMSGIPLPDEEFYEGYLQIENGVGMLRSMQEEFILAMEEIDVENMKPRKVTLATGFAAYKLIKELCDRAEMKYKKLNINVIAIKNNFFGENIIVAGLITGKDIIEQLTGVALGDELLISRSMLRSGGDLFLDNISINELSEKLKIKVRAVENNGCQLLDTMLK